MTTIDRATEGPAEIADDRGAGRGSGPKWAELDVLRGLAAALMVVNHAGYRLFGGETAARPPGVEAALFISSFAPALFFFITGLGYGVQSAARRGGRAHRFGLAPKLAVLLLADAAMWYHGGFRLGLDFLGFIALAMLALEGVVRTGRPGLTAGAAFAAIVATRFAIGPALRPLLPDSGPSTWLRFGLGIGTIDGVSYPICPWMAFPMLGFLVGRGAQARAGWVASAPSRATLALLLASLVPLGLAAVLARSGAIFFRWGTMSVGYFALALAVAAIGLALARLLAAAPRGVADLTSLRGVTSLAVVPAHFFLLGLVGDGVGPGTVGGRVGLAVLIVALSFVLARMVGWSAPVVARLGRPGVLMAGLMLSAIAAIAWAATDPRAWPGRSAAQVLLCYALVIPPPPARGLRPADAS